VSTTSDAVDMVETFLRLVEARQLDEATAFLAPGITITFPGGRRFSNLEEQVASSAGRFRTVRKVFERFDALADVGAVVVYAFGTLEGESLQGNRFSGVRFIDRFEIRHGLIVDQKVWNDMAESKLSDGHDAA